MKKKSLNKGLCVLLAMTMMVPMGAAAESGDYPPYVTEPITIQFQHTFGSGANYEYLMSCIDTFNETNEYGITIEESYGGNYTELQTKLMTDIPAGLNPVLAVQATTGIYPLANAGVLTDLTPYMERDGWDWENVVTVLQDIGEVNDKIVAVPFIRSTYVYSYNAEIYEEMGFDAPTSYEEMIEQSKAIYEAKGIPGFGVLLGAGGFQENLYHSLGGVGYIDEDGLNSSIADNGSFLKVAETLLEGVKGGYFQPPAVSNAQNNLLEQYYRGEVAGLVHSTGNLGQISNNAPFESRTSKNIEFGGYGTCLGGGALTIVGANHDEQEIAAAWEFIKFMLSDEQVAQTTINTGYVPVTYSAAETEALQAFWEENPNFKVAYDCLETAYGMVMSDYRADWQTAVDTGLSYVIQDFSMTPEEANEYLLEQKAIIFGE